MGGFQRFLQGGELLRCLLERRHRGLGQGRSLGLFRFLDVGVFLQAGERDLRALLVLASQGALFYLPGRQQHHRAAFELLHSLFPGLGLLLGAVTEHPLLGGNQQFGLPEPGV